MLQTHLTEVCLLGNGMVMTGADRIAVTKTQGRIVVKSSPGAWGKIQRPGSGWLFIVNACTIMPLAMDFWTYR
jgi:hypothetical protein